jgi:hypothetical protein
VARISRLLIVFLVTLLASLPGGLVQAAGAGTRVIIQLDVPVAMLRCPQCIVGDQAALIRRSVGALAPGDGSSELGRFMRSGVAIGSESFSGAAIELRESRPSAGDARHYVAL